LIVFFLLYGSPVPGQIIMMFLIGFLKVLSFTLFIFDIFYDLIF